MNIRSKTLRRLLVLGTFVVAIIIFLQLFWLQKVYLFEQKQFNVNVSKSIRSLYRDLGVPETSIFEQRVENPQPNTYLVRIDTLPDLDKIMPVISRELTDFGVFTDCKVGLYKSGTDNFLSEKYIDLPDATFNARKDATIPVYQKSYSYIVIFFPNRNRYVMKQMRFWIISGSVVLIALVGLGLSIFYLYHQKFLNETQKEFVNNFTHEFKTPLSVMKIAADVLKNPAIIKMPDKLQNYARIIQDQTLHLQQQTDRLLQIAFTEHKAIALQKEEVDISELVQRAVDDLYPMVIHKNGAIDIQYATDNTMIYADRSYIFLILINLVENAVKYSMRPEIRIHLSRQHKHFVISVKDNGIGIARKHQKKIFDKFYRVTLGDVHHVNGFGLGLSFVKGIIHAHGGSISVESEYGNGSNFIIKIPA